MILRRRAGDGYSGLPPAQIPEGVCFAAACLPPHSLRWSEMTTPTELEVGGFVR